MGTACSQTGKRNGALLRTVMRTLSATLMVCYWRLAVSLVVSPHNRTL